MGGDVPFYLTIDSWIIDYTPFRKTSDFGVRFGSYRSLVPEHHGRFTAGAFKNGSCPEGIRLNHDAQNQDFCFCMLVPMLFLPLTVLNLKCFLAVPMIGAVLHTINVRLSPKQILFTIDHA
jgi:hypothetical protein